MDNIRTAKKIPRVFIDRVLENRVLQFIETKCDPYLTVDDITDHLRNNFFEYARKKRHALKTMVAQIYAENGPSSEEIDVDGNSGDSDANLTKATNANSNRANNSFSNLYAKLNKKEEQRKMKQPSEDCIDLSSDESNPVLSATVSSSSGNPPVKVIAEEDSQPNIKIIEERINVPDASLTNGTVTITPIEKEVIATPSKAKNKVPVKRAAGTDSTFSVSNRSKKRREIAPTDTALSFKDIGGNEKVLKEIVKLSLHMKHIELYSTIGEPPPRGFLLHGPPGSGKTLLAHALAGELGVPLLKVAGPEIVCGISGESEERIRDLFEQAISIAPCILFFDEVDAISPDRESASKEMERRIVAQLLTSLDSLEFDERGKQVLIIGATNRPDSIDPALRRAGRFEREVCLGIPDRESRLEILKVVTKGRKLASDISLKYLAERTPGYVGADLKALMREAALSAISRVSMELESQTGDVDIDVETTSEEECQLHVIDPELKALLLWFNDKTEISEEQLSKVFVNKLDFDNALNVVQPSAKREGFATVPNVTWDDVGSLKDIRDQLQMSIMLPVKYPKLFGKSTPSGVLLCGPPGCGKTLLAKAVANEAGINFISVKGPELLNMYLGESERAVRQCFQRARNSQPCVIFFDEIDALCPKRSGFSDNSSSMRIVNQLLTEMDGFEGRSGVFLMAATNRPDIIDPAVMRPGRFDRVLFVNLPTQPDRKEILLALTKKGKDPLMDEDVDFDKLTADERCDGYSGADLEQLVKEAKEQAILEIVTALSEKKDDVTECEEVKICLRHFETALNRIKPSVSKKDCESYDSLCKRFTSLN